MKLRRKLGKLRSDKWQQASWIMLQISALCGHDTGPSGSQVCPRACHYCHYFGHSSQHCGKRREDERRAEQRMLDREKMELEARSREAKRLAAGGAEGL